MESSKNNRWRRIRLQVQLRFLHRSFSASKSHNCIFDIKFCCNWTWDKGRERQSSGCFVDGSLHFLRNAILYSFSLSVIFSLFSRGSLIPCNLIRHLYLAFVFHGIKQVYFPFSFKIFYLFPKQTLLTWSEIWRGDVGSQLTNFDVIDIWQNGRSCRFPRDSRMLRKIFEG